MTERTCVICDKTFAPSRKRPNARCCSKACGSKLGARTDSKTPDQKIASFWARIDQSGDCWVWTGAKAKSGYGAVTIFGKTKPAHRVAYELAHGVALTSRQFVCHSCDNRACCNPAHLWVGSNQDNIEDMLRKGRQHLNRGTVRGERHGNAKLTEDAVRQIRTSSKRPTELASEYGLSINAVCAVLTRQTWKHVSDHHSSDPMHHYENQASAPLPGPPLRARPIPPR